MGNDRERQDDANTYLCEKTGQRVPRSEPVCPKPEEACKYRINCIIYALYEDHAYSVSDNRSFTGCSIISCGILRHELEQLRRSGVLDADKVLYAAPGLHEWPDKLEKQLTRRLRDAKEISGRAIVVYGSRCFVDTLNPERTTDSLIEEQEMNAVRVKAANCVDMLASKEERERIGGEQKVLWLTPGWLRHWDFIFKDWDAAKYNEMFPRHDKAVVLDALGYVDELMAGSPERILEISDKMQLPIESSAISLERLKRLLAGQIAAITS